eukprot:scaffold28352_cov66-Phaeocystis_antarctica.AAC.2
MLTNGTCASGSARSATATILVVPVFRARLRPFYSMSATATIQRSRSSLVPSCLKQGRRPPPCSDAPRCRTHQRRRACHPPLRRHDPAERHSC